PADGPGAAAAVRARAGRRVLAQRARLRPHRRGQPRRRLTSHCPGARPRHGRLCASRPEGVRRGIPVICRRAPCAARRPEGSDVTKPVVLIAEQLSPATIDALGPDFDIRAVDGTDRGVLLAELADADAVLIRSATKMDAEAIAAAPSLKVIA